MRSYARVSSNSVYDFLNIFRKVLRKNSSLGSKKTSIDSPSTSQARHDILRRPQSGPAVLNNLTIRRMTSVQSLPDLSVPDGPQIMSAPPTPKHGSMYRQSLLQNAPLVNLDELVKL